MGGGPGGWHHLRDRVSPAAGGRRLPLASGARLADQRPQRSHCRGGSAPTPTSKIRKPPPKPWPTSTPASRTRWPREPPTATGSGETRRTCSSSPTPPAYFALSVPRSPEFSAGIPMSSSVAACSISSCPRISKRPGQALTRRGAARSTPTRTGIVTRTAVSAGCPGWRRRSKGLCTRRHAISRPRKRPPRRWKRRRKPCGRARRWRPSASSRAASPTTSTTCWPWSSARWISCAAACRRRSQIYSAISMPPPKARRRAALLTQRLLAFSRQQPLNPQTTDINKVVAGMSDLLRHSLGADIRLETVLAGGLWRTHVDPNQLENVILNLAVNARDAMPDGGRLTIETQNAHLDHRYVCDRAGHCGGAVRPSRRHRHWQRHVAGGDRQGVRPVLHDQGGRQGDRSWPEPGLWLHQAVGRACQNLLGAGRRHDGQDLSAPADGRERRCRCSQAALDVPLGEHAEIVLVVEDESAVRAFAVEALRELGYQVLEADGAAKALEILAAQPSISLLFTDVVMPDVNGKKLADEARRRRPDLKVLFTTGYTRNAIVHNGTLDPGVADDRQAIYDRGTRREGAPSARWRRQDVRASCVRWRRVQCPCCTSVLTGSSRACARRMRACTTATASAMCRNSPWKKSRSSFSSRSWLLV